MLTLTLSRGKCWPSHTSPPLHQLPPTPRTSPAPPPCPPCLHRQPFLRRPYPPLTPWHLPTPALPPLPMPRMQTLVQATLPERLFHPCELNCQSEGIVPKARFWHYARVLKKKQLFCDTLPSIWSVSKDKEREHGPLEISNDPKSRICSIWQDMARWNRFIFLWTCFVSR